MSDDSHDSHTLSRLGLIYLSIYDVFLCHTGHSELFHGRQGRDEKFRGLACHNEYSIASQHPSLHFVLLAKKVAIPG